MCEHERMRPVFTCLAALGALTLGGWAKADEPATSVQGALSPVHERFEAGRRAYRLGDFDRAISEWKQGFEAYGAAELLFNIGQAYRQKQDHERAVFFFESFLQAVPGTTSRAKVEGYLAELRPLVVAAPPKPPGGDAGSPAIVPDASIAKPAPARAGGMAVVLDAGPVVTIPLGSGADLTSRSPGVRVELGLVLLEQLSLRVAGRVVPARGAGKPVTYADVAVGMRATGAVTASIDLFGEVDMLPYAHAQGDAAAEQGGGIGLGARGGATYALRSPWRLGVSLGYTSTVSDRADGWTASWLAVEGTASYLF